MKHFKNVNQCICNLVICSTVYAMRFIFCNFILYCCVFIEVHPGVTSRARMSWAVLLCNVSSSGRWSGAGDPLRLPGVRRPEVSRGIRARQDGDNTGVGRTDGRRADAGLPDGAGPGDDGAGGAGGGGAVAGSVWRRRGWRAGCDGVAGAADTRRRQRGESSQVCGALQSTLCRPRPGSPARDERLLSTLGSSCQQASSHSKTETQNIRQTLLIVTALFQELAYLNIAPIYWPAEARPGFNFNFVCLCRPIWLDFSRVRPNKRVHSSPSRQFIWTLFICLTS